MNLWVEKPKMIRRAVYRQRGLHWSLEFLIAFAVYMAANIFVTIALMPYLLIQMYKAGYMEAVAEGDVQRSDEILLAVQNADSFQIASLFAFLLITATVLLFARFLQKRPLNTLGFVKKGLVIQYLIGGFIGFVIFSAAVLFCVVTGALTFSGISERFEPGILVLFALGYLIQGMAEEVLCRGYMLTSIARRSPVWLAIVLNSLFFAMLHLMNAGITLLAFFNLFLFGVFASLYFLRTKNIWGISAIHSVWNFVQGNFYGIQVSGMGKSPSVLASVSVAGKEVLNGGSFGLEGGLGVTFALIAGTLLVMFLPDRKGEKQVESSEAEIKTVLFDLDGTLLPMDQNVFVNGYLSMLTQKMAPLGYEPNLLVKTIWEGVEDMVKNDGSCTNEEAFWKRFTAVYGMEAMVHKPLFDEFYRNEFQGAVGFCGRNPLAEDVVKRLKDLGYKVVLATNPLFPSVATESRIRWAGLLPKDFYAYTTYENCNYCKPNLDYYRELLTRIGNSPKECLMVGNDVGEDMVAMQLGMKGFLLTDCLINGGNGDISVYPNGNLKDFLRYLEETEA